MEVDHDDGCTRADRVHELVDHLPRRHRSVDEEHAEEVHDADGDPVARLQDRPAAAGELAAGVRRPDDAIARRQVRADSVATEGVVAERDRVRPGGEDPLRELAGDAGAVGDVLAVDDAEVDVELLAQAR
jgi:hypothetical protein